MTQDYATIRVKPVCTSGGAEIEGVDLSRELTEQEFSEIRAASDEHGVIFFRDQNLTPEQHIKFAKQWGEININRFFTPVEGYPEIAEVRKERKEKSNIGNTWHTDHSYDQIPAFGSILYAREVPDVGGDTVFAGMVAAYEGLSDGLKQVLKGLNAVHSSRHVFGEGQFVNTGEKDLTTRIGNAHLAKQDAVHPVVLTHPRTGRQGLYVNPQFTTHFEGWSAEESRPLLDFLAEHATKEEYLCRFRWTNGAMAIWDNLATWHRAVNDYHGQRRLMHRITIEGTEM